MANWKGPGYKTRRSKSFKLFPKILPMAISISWSSFMTKWCTIQKIYSKNVPKIYFISRVLTLIMTWPLWKLIKYYKYKKKRISQKCNWIFPWNEQIFYCAGKIIFSEVTIFTRSNLLFVKGKMHVYLYEKDSVADLIPVFCGSSSIQNRTSYRRNCKRNPALLKYSFLMPFSHIF